MLVVGACGPRLAANDGSVMDGPGEGTNADVGASGSANEADESRGTDPAGTTDGEFGDTCVLGDPAACPEGCYRGNALQVNDDACTAESIDVCLPAGPKPGLPLGTYWALAPSGPIFAEYGGQCTVAARPDAWHECSGAADEPPDCACFCQNGYCRGDEDRRALDECALDSPCDQLYVDPQFGAVDHGVERCVLEGLGVRTPGVYEITTLGVNVIRTTRLYVFGNDEVARIDLVSDDVFSCPQTSEWGAASRCTLASGAFFASCLEPQPKGEACIDDLDAWVSACSEPPPTCG